MRCNCCLLLPSRFLGEGRGFQRCTQTGQEAKDTSYTKGNSDEVFGEKPVFVVLYTLPTKDICLQGCYTYILMKQPSINIVQVISNSENHPELLKPFLKRSWPEKLQELPKHFYQLKLHFAKFSVIKYSQRPPLCHSSSAVRWNVLGGALPELWARNQKTFKRKFLTPLPMN